MVKIKGISFSRRAYEFGEEDLRAEEDLKKS